MTTLLEAMDVARRLGVGPARVTAMARQGTLVPFATTPRGLRLFTEAEVERLRAERAQRCVRAAANAVTTPQ
jgi:DNA-binding transcriptional MerR regulator